MESIILYRIEEIKRGEISPLLKTGKAIVIDENEPFVGWKYGEAFARYIEKGEHVKFVLSLNAENENYLKAKDIKEKIFL